METGACFRVPCLACLASCGFSGASVRCVFSLSRIHQAPSQSRSRLTCRDPSPTDRQGLERRGTRRKTTAPAARVAPPPAFLVRVRCWPPVNRQIFQRDSQKLCRKFGRHFVYIRSIIGMSVGILRLAADPWLINQVLHRTEPGAEP